MATSDSRFPFTSEKLSKLVCPPSGRPSRDGRIWVYDTKVDGLAYSITETGNGAFFFYRRVNGTPKKKRLGTLAELNVESARRRVAGINNEVAKGHDPFAEAKAAQEKAKREANFGTLWESYRANWLAQKRPATIEAFTRLYDQYLAKWKTRPITSIIKADIETLKTEVGADHPATANRLLTIISAMYRRRGHAFGMADGFTPTANVDDYPETARERVLTNEELAAVMSSIDAEDNDTIRDYFRMLIYTGQRKQTVATMTWQDVSMQAGTWRIPGVKLKNKSTLTLSLIPEAMKILKRRHDGNPEDNPFVFPGRAITPGQADQIKALRAAGHSTRAISEQTSLSQTTVMQVLSPRFIPRQASAFNGAGKAWARILKRAKIQHATIHDVRRTFCTNLIEQGVPLPVVSAVMGHRSSATTAKHYAFASDRAVAAATHEAMGKVLANVAKAQKTA